MAVRIELGHEITRQTGYNGSLTNSDCESEETKTIDSVSLELIFLMQTHVIPHDVIRERNRLVGVRVFS